MGENVWVVAPDTKTIDGLTFVDRNGKRHTFWIKVKKRLTVGESRGMRTAGFGAMKPGQLVDINWKRTAFARVVTYLQGWSLEKDQDTHEPLELTPDIVEALEEDAFNAIAEAIDKHIDDMEAEKKRMAGATESTATPA